MSNDLSLSQADFLLLNNDIRVTSNSVFHPQEAFDNAFEDVLLDEVKTSQIKENNSLDDKCLFSNLGAPAGFFIDMSLIDENGELNIDSNSNSPNPNLKKYLS